MTTFLPRNVKCGVCGNVKKVNIIGSTNAMGYMDLDTRPPMMARHNLAYEIQMCPRCFYANTSIERVPENFIKNIMKTDEYVSIVNDPTINDVAKAYLLAGYIKNKLNDYRSAGFWYLKAAWSFDDRKDIQNAIMAREEALANFEKELEDNYEEHLTLITVDIRRRIKKFDEAIKTAEKLLEKVEDEFIRKLIIFEISLANQKDSLCHDLGETL